MPQHNNLLLIFTRNPELGKVKKRLAATVGHKAALEIYQLLLRHTATVAAPLDADKEVYYSEYIPREDNWNEAVFSKKLQEGADLGERMEQAFREGFDAGYEKIVIIGSDLYDVDTTCLSQAFDALERSDYVLGPATDGGYYLLGMKALHEKIFKNKSWSSDNVFRETLTELEPNKVTILEERNDIDHYEDLPDLPVFKQFLK